MAEGFDNFMCAVCAYRKFNFYSVQRFKHRRNKQNNVVLLLAFSAYIVRYTQLAKVYAKKRTTTKNTVTAYSVEFTLFEIDSLASVFVFKIVDNALTSPFSVFLLH